MKKAILVEKEDELLFPCFQAVAQKMKELRKQYSLTQKEMAVRLNIDPQYYARLERADDPKRRFTLEKVLMACSFFNISPNDMLTKLPDYCAIGDKDEYNRVALQTDVSRIMKGMSVEQLNNLRAMLDKFPKGE